MNKKRILCVEDNHIEARIIEKLLSNDKSRRYKISFADSLEQAKAVITESVFDAILLNLNLPDSSEINTFLTIKSIALDTPIIVITSLNNEELIETVIQSGAQDYLIKGNITADLLSHSIRYAIDRQVFSLKVKTTQRQFIDLIEKNSDGIIIVNTKGILKYMNSASEQLFGWKRSELIGEIFGFPIVKGESTEITINKKNNDFCLVEMKSNEIIWNDEIVYLTSMRDITEKERLRKIILEERNNSQFFSDLMAHDINNMDHGILSNLEMVMQMKDVPQTALKHISKSLILAEKISSLINNIQVFVESNKETKQLDNIDFKDVLLKVIEIVKSGSSGKEIYITHDFTDNEVIVKGDKLLESVFDNLLGNAVKYNKNDSVDIEITHKISEDKQWYSFYFKDNGIGIPEADRDSMFGRFARGDVKTKVLGHGIGLMLVKRIVESYGGKIWIENAVKDDYTLGSAFVFLLPVGTGKLTSMSNLYDDDQNEMIYETFQR